MENNKQKILICGDIRGKFAALFFRVCNINNKVGPLDYVFCVGDFFGTTTVEDFKAANITVPVPTFILGPTNSENAKQYPSVENQEFHPNVTCLGRKGIFSTTSGLKIAYLSGIEDNNPDNPYSITEADVESVRLACIKDKSLSFIGIDILLTSAWPAGVTKYDKQPVSNPPAGSRMVSKLVSVIKPRYHFCAHGSLYYERCPYKNLDTGDAVCHVTRMVALAEVGNKDRHKWVFAVSITPIQHMKRTDLAESTTDTTVCPYLPPPTTSNNSKPQQFFFDMSPKPDDKALKRKNNCVNHVDQFKRIKQMNISRDDCWFCISSKSFEKHLVIHVGEESYLSLAKGPLVPDHGMILPVSHYSSHLQMPESTGNEIKRLKSSLDRLYQGEDKVAVFFERNYLAPHLQIQVVPIPAILANRLKVLFLRLAEEKKIPMIELPENVKLEDVIKIDSTYFYVEIPAKNIRLLHIIKKQFPLQFGREVLAHKQIFNVAYKVDWKRCKLSKEEEVRYVIDFRTKLKRFINDD